MTDDEWQAYAKQQRRAIAGIVVLGLLMSPLLLIGIFVEWIRGIYGRIRRQ